MIIIALLACAVITGILLLQPRTLKVTTGTPLTQAGAYEGPGGGTLYVTPSHRLVGAVTLPETPYGSSFIVVPLDSLQPDFEEMQSFFLGDSMVCDYLEQEDGYFLLVNEREKVVYRNADILDWCTLFWLDCSDGTMTTLDKMEAAGIPSFLESADGEVLLGWQGRDSAYINHYDSTTRQRTAIQPVEVRLTFSTPLGGGQYLGFWRDYGGNFQESSLDVKKQLAWVDEEGNLLDSYPCDKDYHVTGTCVVGDRGYALLHHDHRQRCRLLTMNLDRENRKLVNVRYYTLPRIGNSKFTDYDDLVWNEDAGLQLLFLSPYTWDSGASILGTATILDDGTNPPELELHTYWAPQRYLPNGAFQQNGETFYQFSTGSKRVFFQ
ncbi:hypothetical protein SUBVAR_06850 [Subdoligranulum variabile DSM 15176]|uniref:Uncharacterized protein n=1 Tax=Subdoligranulum variabile DSM 15176 TaxID=411471 RepID=D1PR23_9FIRM|nr:hypothetical protein SUBVAR_06850 [Subdoligranulum variabile DSM 15176]